VTPTPNTKQSDAYTRFLSSMQIDYEKWHDGVGYDLDALAQIHGEEQRRVEAMLIERMEATPDWRDIEALKAIGTPTAKQTIRKALKSHAPEVRLHAAGQLEDAGESVDIEQHIIDGLQQDMTTGAASKALDLAAEHPTPRIRKALLDAALDGKDSTLRVNAAALAMYLASKAKEPFDWDHRPFFLRFGEEDRDARFAAWKELAAICDDAESKQK
jgi:hypothetical protein